VADGGMHHDEGAGGGIDGEISRFGDGGDQSGGMQHTPTSQVDIELYQHVMVLISIILALSVYHLVYGVAGFIQHPTRHRVSLLHLGWVAWVFLNVITFWWWEFNLSLIPRWNFGLYFFVFIYSCMYFFLSVLLFPEDLSGYAGYQDYFLSRRVWFFGFVALTELLDVIDSWIKGAEYLSSLDQNILFELLRT
jgi:hypothetical protein